jgi:O-antigen ligase
LAYASLIVYILLLFIRPQEWVPGILNLPIITPVMCVAILATFMEVAGGKWHFKDVPQNWLVLGFFGAVIASNLLSFQQPLNFGVTLDVTREFGKIILLYFLIAINLKTIRQVKGFILAIIIGCLFIAVHGILQIHTGAGFGGLLPLYVSQEHAYRIIAFGFFSDPNDVAQALLVALPFLISGIHRPGIAAPWRLVSLVAAGVIGYAIFLTGSRGGWLALAVMMVAYFLLNFRQKKISVVLGILALGGLLMFAPARVQTGSTHDQSAKGRIVSWTEGNKMLKMSPLFGIGKSRFAEYSDTGLVAHNSFVHCWGELGLFGYFWWLGMLFASVKDSYALGKERTGDPKKDEMGRVARVLLASWIGFMAAAVFLSRTYKPELYILIGLVAAMHAIREREGGPLPRAFVKRDLRWVLLVELTSIPFFYCMMRFMW